MRAQYSPRHDLLRAVNKRIELAAEWRNQLVVRNAQRLRDLLKCGPQEFAIREWYAAGIHEVERR